MDMGKIQNILEIDISKYLGVLRGDFRGFVSPNDAQLAKTMDLCIIR